MTIAEWLRLGEARLLAGPHPERARQDAEALLMHLLGKPRSWLLAHADDELGFGAPESYTAPIERRHRGEPIQYILGETEFYGMPFRVTPDVLIPRPETEHLVEKAIQLFPLFHTKSTRFFEGHRVRTGEDRKLRRESADDTQIAGWPPRVLDIGTGSGAIAISIAHDWAEAEITAIDSSREALEVARGNAARLGYFDDVRFLQGDLLAPVEDERFELIVSNPPYVAERDRASLAVEVREYEPAQALFAGGDGLEVIRRLIPAAHAALVPGGYLLMEMGQGQWPEVKRLMEAAGFANLESVPDLQGIPRVACGQRP